MTGSSKSGNRKKKDTKGAGGCRNRRFLSLFLVLLLAAGCCCPAVLLRALEAGTGAETFLAEEESGKADGKSGRREENRIPASEGLQILEITEIPDQASSAETENQGEGKNTTGTDLPGEDSDSSWLEREALILAETESPEFVRDGFATDEYIEVMDEGESGDAELPESESNPAAEQTEPEQMTEEMTGETGAESETESEEETESGLYQKFLEALEKWRDDGVDAANWQEVQSLQEQIEEAFAAENLTEEEYRELRMELLALLEPYYRTMAEAAEGSSWERLRDSGWFEAFGGSAAAAAGGTAAKQSLPDGLLAAAAEEASVDKPSAVQIADQGGSNASRDGRVWVSKTIAGTELENVFDITLQVRTTENISELYEDPDMAVVIVMDISNTMNSTFGETTRYKAAMDAAEQFLDQFAKSTKGVQSKIGYVAFNTDAHCIFDLQSCCSTVEQANRLGVRTTGALKNLMRTETGRIINAAGYNESHSRFTNIEAGLKLGRDMLAGAANQNKYLIFLSDGFPTTYISSGYRGYDPYDADGKTFQDRVLHKPCTYGTSYSDKAAIRARQMAEQIKAGGIRIFSIGVDVGGQTIQQYIDQSEKSAGFSVVDRTGTSYEIGAANSPQAYQTWLQNRIGSGYYYDSTDSEGLKAAYDQIFAQIRHLIAQKAEAQWVAKDPLPFSETVASMVEFIGFYDRENILIKNDLNGAWQEKAENTASFLNEEQAIQWDLKKSGYQRQTVGNVTAYQYEVKYRVRLKNETSGFMEKEVYQTNAPTILTYQTIEQRDAGAVISDPKTLSFPVPSVKGYLAELQFRKQDNYGRAVAGAEFTLRHDIAHCTACHGDGSSTALASRIAVSDAEGAVSFTGIPSGHQYELGETGVPDGYYKDGKYYKVTVAYDGLSVLVTDASGHSVLPIGDDGETLPWDRTIINHTGYRLPETGGVGTGWYTMGGLLLTLAGSSLLYKKKRKRDGR